MDLPSAHPKFPVASVLLRRVLRRVTTIATRLVIFLDQFALYGMRLLLCARAGF
jgi:hypothetical protein